MGAGLTGGVTCFLFSDVEGSTRLWESHPDDMSGALERHDVIMRRAFDRHGGRVFSIAGDSFGAAFDRVEQGCAAAAEIQEALAEVDWPDTTPIRVRMGLHVGVAEPRDDNYFGPAVNRAARIMAAASGGQTVVSDRVAGLVRGEHELIDLGRQQLKDLAEPERIWQLGAGDHAPLRAVRGADVRLPEPSSLLVGREKEEVELIALLEESRCVCITGPGGIGKTRMALAVASQMLPGFPGGAAFADLDEISDGDDVADLVAAAVGVRQAPGSTVTESLVAWYRDRRALLVLDNCETVLDAATELIELLTDASPALAVLATSRQRLRSPRVVAAPLEPIGDASTRDLLIARVRDLDPSFDPDQHADDLTALAARLDGVPLAVELAAARLRALTPGQLVARLDSRPELLADPDRGERHRSLDATLAGSVDALSDDARLMFARCSVFVGSFDLESAEQVIGHSPLDELAIADGLLALVDASLVQRNVDGTFRMLAPVRDAARTRLDPADEVGLHHLAHFCGLARSIGAGVAGPDEGSWAALTRAQFGNIRAAWETALERDDVGSAADIVFGLWRHLFDQMQFEVLRWAEETLELADRHNDGAAAADCLAAASAGYLHLARYDDLHAAVRRLNALGDAATHARPVAYAMRALAYSNQGEAETAAALAHTTRAAAVEAGDQWFEAMCHVFLRDFDRAVSGGRRLDNPSLWSWFHVFRGFSRLDEGDLVAAGDDFAEGESLARRAGNAQAMGVARNEIGSVATRSADADLDAALLPLDQALGMFVRLRTPFQLWNSLEIVAQAFARAGIPEPAATLWSAVDAEGVRPASVDQRSDAGMIDVALYPDAVDAGKAMDVWRAADYARRVIRDTIDPVRESRAAG